MPFRLPPPWDPGFALPANVADEGLQRRAFVTKQAPRGTYDNPRVGTGGYVVPQYVQKEGYGQGSYTTKWLPSGSTPGGVPPHYLNQRPQVVASSAAPGGGTAFTIARHAMGDVEPHPVYKRYGDKAATHILARIAQLPPAHRDTQMRALMNRMDPTLYGTALAHAAKFRRGGMPAPRALHAGVSRAVAQTLLANVQQAGRTGRPTGLMKLAGIRSKGCSSCDGGEGYVSAMGAVPLIAGKLIGSGTLVSALAKLLPNAQTGPGGIAPGTCDSTGQFIWDAGGFWRRKMAGEQCIGTSSATPVVRGGSGGGISVVGADGKPLKVRPAPTIAPGTTKLITVGPFTFPLVDQMNIHWRGLLPDDWRAALNQQLTRDCSPCISSSMRAAGDGSAYAPLRAFLGPEMPTSINHDFIGVNPGGKLPSVAGIDPTTASQIAQMMKAARSPDQPIVTTHRPDNGEHWGLWAYLEPVDPSKPYDPNTNPWNLRLQWREVHDGVWGWIWDVLSTIADWAGDVIDAIGSLTCDILSNPVGQVGAVAAGAAAGGAGGAKAGAVGAQVGAQLCAQPPPSAVVTSSSPLVPLAIAGVAVVGIAAVLKKKRHP